MPPAPAARRLVCVGRLCEQKGQLLLVEAARRLAAQGIEFELVLAGDGELRSEIEALIGRYKLQDRVRITGWISGDEVREQILAARALVLPSFAEGLPIVIMEAMALKRPVISTFVAGIPELVHPGEHGWLVPAGDVEALADVMRACLETPVETLVRMGEAAHKRVLERHSVDTRGSQAQQVVPDCDRRRECMSLPKLHSQASPPISDFAHSRSCEPGMGKRAIGRLESFPRIGENCRCASCHAHPQSRRDYSRGIDRRARLYSHR